MCYFYKNSNEHHGDLTRAALDIVPSSDVSEWTDEGKWGAGGKCFILIISGDCCHTLIWLECSWEPKLSSEDGHSFGEGMNATASSELEAFNSVYI